jgi:hypothetical protein
MHRHIYVLRGKLHRYPCVAHQAGYRHEAVDHGHYAHVGIQTRVVSVEERRQPLLGLGDNIAMKGFGKGAYKTEESWELKQRFV